ncbi:hypothetical protein EIN_197930 [Entamoeba invadens IP1]|uniref:Uncharacterized protein n=1 Tax=Entamoeba invadens IP1 TaxID=370355 RepID=A0A0A1TUR3_ENTIV|nr:hypothetical protein EIN_197930 [Entamoeba invadens IP1]ELP83850.1 hypothetical protein EIN_197930 [Entamoeba invadens IP1]|eukprot:XP_004183196.1 hypothetical protein EIN_197930 [Entamoeba invadens IP1]
MFIVILYLNLVTAIPCNKLQDDTMYTPDGIFECINSEISSDSVNTKIASNMEKMVNIYVSAINRNTNKVSHPIDLLAQVKEIETSTQPIYTFQQAIFKTFLTAKDPSLYLRFPTTHYFTKTIALLPYTFRIIDSKYYLIPNPSNKYYDIKVDSITEEIKAINSLSPHDFFLNFGMNSGYNTQHAMISWALNMISIFSLQVLPLEESILKTPIVVTLLNETNVNMNYQMYYTKDPPQIVRYANGVLCQTSPSRGINVLHLFSLQKTDAEALNKCVQTFDTNDYPIAILVQDFAGGDVNVANSLHDALMRHDDTRLIGSMRAFQEMNNMVVTNFRNSSCGKVTPRDLLEGYRVDYIENATFVHTETLYFKHDDIIVGLYDNVRYSYQIVIFSDGTCTGVCGQFALGLVSRGSAISVVYGENDEKARVAQDASLSLENGMLQKLFPNFQIYAFEVGLPFFETYDYSYSHWDTLKESFEFLRVVPDFHFNSTSHYDTFSQFATDAFRALNLFATECNEENDRIAYDSGNCSGTLFTHEHNGYLCDDGKWSQNCSLSYCDYNYYVDITDMVCVENSCLNDDAAETPKKIIVIILCTTVVVITTMILIVILGLFIFSMYRKNQKVGYQELD